MGSTKILLIFSQCMNLLFVELSISVKILQTTAVDHIHLMNTSDYFSCKNDLRIFCKHQCIQCLLPTELKDVNELDEFSYRVNSISEFRMQNFRLSLKFAKSRKLHIVTAYGPPFAITNFSKDGKEIFLGTVFEFLDAIGSKYNLRYKIFTSNDGKFGEITKEGTWSGIIGHIARKEADIGLAGVTIALDRSKVVDFTTAFHQDTSTILTPPPTENSEKITILIRPFSPKVWLHLGLTIFLLVPTFYYLHVLHYIIRKQWKNEKKKSGIKTKLFMYIIGSLIQNSVVSPTDKSTRIIITIWWMTSLILINRYVGFMVALLSVPKLENTINSLEELVAQSKIKWTLYSGTSIYSFFKSNTSVGIFKVVGDRVNDEDLISITDESNLISKLFKDMELDTKSEGRMGSNYAPKIARVIEQNYALIADKSFLEAVLDSDFNRVRKCRMTLAKQEFLSAYIALVVQKNSPILIFLNYEISMAVSTGLMEKWKAIHWPKHLYCSNAVQYIISTNTRPKKLNFEDIKGSIVLWLIGTTVGTFTVVLEILIGYLIH